jgi:transcriptional regulator with XRE-family HTH domain
MATDNNPVARRWQLAAQLRAIREEAGKTADEAATELMCSVAKISRMETAGRGIQPRDVRDLCRFYGTSKAIQDELIGLAEEAQQPGWWQDFRTLSEDTTTFIGLESAAHSVRSVDALRLSGLLQNRDYTAALLEGMRFAPNRTTRWVEETIEARVKRQERVESGELAIHQILDESALRRLVGGYDVMVRQVERLLTEVARPNVTLQVIPFELGPHPGLDGAFTYLSFPSGRIDDIVYIEQLVGNQMLDKPPVVKRYLDIFDYLVRYALSPDDTIVWLEALLSELTAQAPRGRESHAPQQTGRTPVS